MQQTKRVYQLGRYQLIGIYRTFDLHGQLMQVSRPSRTQVAKELFFPCSQSWRYRGFNCLCGQKQVVFVYPSDVYIYEMMV